MNQERKEIKGLRAIIVWILNFLLILSVIVPVTADEEKNVTINVGPCVWIIERNCPDNDIKFYLYTRSNYEEAQYIHIDKTLEQSNLTESNFDPKKSTKIVIHGYNSDIFLRSLFSLKNEYLQKSDYNIFYVDWSILTPGPCYVSSVHNTKHAGACVAQLVERILDSGSSDIHVIGFSLGAQLTNYVARNLGSFQLPRITGLDPAMPLFITASNDDKLDASDAEFVDVIHTNALVQGKMERCGHVDFYINGGIMQPGCFQESNPFACSHQRAPKYFAESIRSYTGFWGWACSSYINYLLGLCPMTNYLVEAGENARKNLDGMYLIVTNSEEPFALGKWTENDFIDKKHRRDTQRPFNRHNPMMKHIDQWGKLEGTFNNIMNFPTPFPQDPISGNWPYFGPAGPKEITDDLKDDEDLDSDEKSDEETYIKVRKKIPTRQSNSKFHRKEPQRTVSPLEKLNLENLNKTKNITNAWDTYKQKLMLGIVDNNKFKLPEIIKK